MNAKDAFLEQKTLLRSVFPTKIQQNAKNPTEIQQSAKTQQKTQLKSNKKTQQLGFWKNPTKIQQYENPTPNKGRAVGLPTPDEDLESLK